MIGSLTRPAPLSPAFAERVASSGRSWWRAHYRDGRTISEWDTPPVLQLIQKAAVPGRANWRQTRWEDVPKRNMIGLELFCPNGMVGALKTDRLTGHRFIQFKRGGLQINQSSGRYVEASVIGVVNDDDTVLLWTFEPVAHQFVVNLRTGRCLLCALEPGICPGSRLTTPPPFDEATGEIGYDPRFKYLFTFTDDVRSMRYRNIGPLSLDVQGVKL